MLSSELLTAYAAKMSVDQGRSVDTDEARDEIHRVVRTVASQFAGKSFGSHDGDDIVHTCVLRGLEALAEGNYDPSRDLGRFLYVHMRNQLSNAMRSQMSRRESPCECCSVLDPPDEPCDRYRKYLRANEFRKSLARVVGGQNSAATHETPDQIVMARELESYIRERLDPRLLPYYEGMLVDELPQGARLTQIRDAVRAILIDSPYADMLPPAKPRKRTHKITLTWRGQTHPLVDWSEIVGVDVATLYWRRQHGWSTERILTSPAGPTRRRPA